MRGEGGRVRERKGGEGGGVKGQGEKGGVSMWGVWGRGEVRERRVG